MIRSLLALALMAGHLHHHHRWRTEPRWWLRQAACIRHYESRNEWHIPGGAYQFLISTWRSVGGVGLPREATPRRQTFRAWRVWNRDGGSWREWTTAARCGLR